MAEPISSSRDEAVRIAKAWLAEPDKRETAKRAIKADIGPKTAALIDEGAVMARYILSESVPSNAVELRVDQQREDNWSGRTGIFVRAKLPDDSFGSVDIGELDRASLHAWLRSRGGKNIWAENLVLELLEHKQITEEEDGR